MEYWSGKFITSLKENEIFVAGTNPQGRHGKGAAAAAVKLGGAIYGKASGMIGPQAYGIITKSLKAGFTDKNGVTYHLEGERSISPEQIRKEIDILYQTAMQPEHQNKRFLISYQYETYPNGTPKKSLNGYTSQETLEMFAKDQDIPPNVVFHESYKPHLEKLLNTPKENHILLQNKVLNVLPNLIVISPRDVVPEGFTVINTTSRDDFGKNFSPFYLSNIPTYDGYVAKNMENAWQFSKVYAEFVDSNQEPTPEYFKWAKKGWDDTYAHRYANGKGNIPLYSYWKTVDDKGQWHEHKWDYITARKNIYFPLYAKAIVHSNAFKELQKRVSSGEKIALWDFDGYNHAKRGMTYEEVVNEPKYKCGHAFVLYGLLTGELKVVNNELIYDFKLEHKDEYKDEPIAFTKVALPFGWMGNMAPYPVEHEGITYRTTEALFQALRFSKHPEIQEAIRNQSSPMGAKMATKPHRHLLEADGFEMMGEQDVANMRLCVQLKLEQHPDLAQQLLDTGNRQIIEDCTSRPRDSGLFWGSAYQNGEWIGKNVLGEILMEKRDELKLICIEKDQHLPSLINYRNYEFISVEQFIMFSKAKTFKDEELANKIINLEQTLSDNRAARDLIIGFKNSSITRDNILAENADTWETIHHTLEELGKNVANYDESVWDVRKIPVTSIANREKYSQNPHIKITNIATQENNLPIQSSIKRSL